MKKVILILFILVCASDAFAREHPYFISNIAMSNDAKYIAIRRMDNKIVILNREEKKVYKVLEDANRIIGNLIAFTPDSRQFVFQHYDNDLIFYDLYEQKINKKIPIGYSLSSIAFFNDMKRFICGGVNGKMELINTITNERKTLKVPHPEPRSFFASISSIKLSPDENYFVTTTFTGDWRKEPNEDVELVESTKTPSGNVANTWNVKHIGLNLWDAKTFKKIKKMRDTGLNGHTWPVFSPGGKYVVSSCDGGGIYIWDGKTGEHIRGVNFLSNGIGFINNDYVVGLFTSGSRPRMFLDSIDRFIKDESFEKPGQKSLKEFFIKPRACQGAIATDPARNIIAIGTVDGSISVYKFNPEKLDIELEWHPKSVEAGLIKWLSPADTMFKTTDEVNEMVKQYEINQLRLIEEDRSKGTVETKYETIQINNENQKDQKQPIPTLTPVK